MSDTDLHKLVHGLSKTSIATPVHKRALRARLLAQHANQQTGMRHLLGTFRTTITTGVLANMKKNILTAGVSALVVTALAVGVFSSGAMSNDSVSAAQLINDVVAKTAQMSPSEITQFNEQWSQDVSQRLAQAQNAGNLRIVSADEVNAMGGSIAKAGAGDVSYLTYTDGDGHRIVIGLNDAEEPVLLHDLDAAPDTSAPTPSMQR